jgi:hypothetical protein
MHAQKHPTASTMERFWSTYYAVVLMLPDFCSCTSAAS